MPVGIITNVISVFIGSLIGANLKKFIPKYLMEELPKIFGICSFTIGIMSVISVRTLPMVIMAVIIGYVIGEMVHIDHIVSHCFSYLLNKLSFFKVENDDDYMDLYLLVVLMFSMSGMGLFGALSEGMSGDSSVLISKSVLDFFTAILFGASLGYAQTLICLPQFFILMFCFLIAKSLLPYLNETMIIDFKACGGLITMITGLTVSKILKVKAINLVPALILVMPFVALFSLL